MTALKAGWWHHSTPTTPHVPGNTSEVQGRRPAQTELLICMPFDLYTGKSRQKIDFTYTGKNRIYIKEGEESGEEKSIPMNFVLLSLSKLLSSWQGAGARWHVQPLDSLMAHQRNRLG